MPTGGHLFLRAPGRFPLWVGWYVALAVFQPYCDWETGDNQSLNIQVARPGIEPRTSCSASQELNHSTTAAPLSLGHARVLMLRPISSKLFDHPSL